jgi:hypothetical protein
LAATRLSDTEIARRLPVWCALSDAFLDTELDAHAYRHMANVICAQGFTAAEAEAIFRTEVGPAFAGNLWSVAGEWAGWPEATVRERVLANRNGGFAAFVNRITLGRHLDEEWAHIAAHLQD